MKTTINRGTIANPRRTTLAHLQDADELTTEAVPAGQSASGDDLPAHTANPRRTTLQDAPAN